ncbi:MAG: basic amino acid ABC transporter substrate-binding protein [Eubacteriales bacterium]|nr:basic amino acid ABC transporter substrate-binding protein [Eubacteriales bacterium]
MKKLVVAALAGVMVLSLTACGNSAKKETEAATTEAATEAATTEAAEAETTEAAETEEMTEVAAVETAAEEEKTAEGGTLVMATNAEFPPYEYHEGDDIVGIDAEVAALIASELGMELQIEDMAFDSVLAAVQSGKADIAMAGITVTEDRKQVVSFSDSYVSASQLIIVAEDSEIAGPDDLVGKKIGVQLGTTGDIYVEDVEDASVERFSKGFEAVQALMQGKVDAVVIDGEPAKVFVNENEEIKLLDQPFTEEEYAIAVAKENEELLGKINDALAVLKENGEFDAVVNKYIGDGEQTAETEAVETEAAEETEAASEAASEAAEEETTEAA